MLKEQLLAESKQIDTEIKLDGIFEGVELTESVKSQFEIVFAESVKKRALELAESHIQSIAEKAEEKVEEEVEKKTKEKEEKLKETCNKFFAHLATEWLKENALPVDKGIKADLFDSVMVGMKGLFVEHNVIVPEEGVDIVAELEAEMQESKDVASKYFEQLQEQQKENIELKRDAVLKEATLGLTESQKEKVEKLIEGTEFDEKYEGKLIAMVEMAKIKSTTVPAKEQPKPLTENLNFQGDEKPAEQPTKVVDPMMAQFVQAANLA